MTAAVVPKRSFKAVLNWIYKLPITHIHTYLVHPAKGASRVEPIVGSSLKLSGKMYDLVKTVYDLSDEECDIAISFNKSSSGLQQNECRDLLLKYATKPNVINGRNIAQRLALHTDKRSRLGLLFLIVGREGLNKKVIISRFPADSGIMAESVAGALNVEFLERIFMKSAKSYKSVLYQSTSTQNQFWKGLAVDKQMNDPDSNVSGYWISDFLDSDFLTTSAGGTRRLAVACRDAARKVDDTNVKSEIAAAVTLASGQNGRRMSVNDFLNRMGLSGAAKAAILSEIKPNLVKEKFQFNSQEFSRQVAYRSLELDNGGILVAETAEFEKIFIKENVAKRDGVHRYVTEGRVVNQKLTKSVR